MRPRVSNVVVEQVVPAVALVRPERFQVRRPQRPATHRVGFLLLRVARVAEDLVEVHSSPATMPPTSSAATDFSMR